MQTMLTLVRGDCERLFLPDADTLVRGVPWGRFDEIGTPAYWKGQCWQAELHGRYGRFRLGRTLVEETAACLLGGYGMPAELGLAAFGRLVERERLSGTSTVETIEADLAEPLPIEGRMMRYRFPRQKARYLVGCLHLLNSYVEPMSDRRLRDDLVAMPGIGPKTASWIVRNHRSSDEVAILDIHVLRAGCFMGVFPSASVDASSYAGVETAFLEFAAAISVKASLLDNVIWRHMRLMSNSFASASAETSPSGSSSRAYLSDLPSVEVAA